MHPGIRVAGQRPALHVRRGRWISTLVGHRGAPLLSGTRFDVEFRVLGNDGSELLSKCVTVTVK
jgi:hypothetical protein